MFNVTLRFVERAAWFLLSWLPRGKKKWEERELLIKGKGEAGTASPYRPCSVSSFIMVVSYCLITCDFGRRIICCHVKWTEIIFNQVVYTRLRTTNTQPEALCVFPFKSLSCWHSEVQTNQNQLFSFTASFWNPGCVMWKVRNPESTCLVADNLPSSILQLSEGNQWELFSVCLFWKQHNEGLQFMNDMNFICYGFHFLLL